VYGADVSSGRHALMRAARRAGLGLVTCAAVLAPVGWTGTASAGAIANASTVVRAPVGAARVPVASLDGVACASPTACVAVGRYAASSGRGLPLAATMSPGGWARAVTVALPAGHAGAHSTAGLSAVACPSATSCVAVGSYEDTANDELPMVATERDGTWGPAAAVALPATAASTNEQAQLGAVACVPAGCVAVGTYTTATGAAALMAASSTAGTWGAATTIALPSGAGAVPRTAGSVALSGLSCTDEADCVAVGAYLDHAGGFAPLRVTLAHGVWGRAVRVHVALRTRVVSVAELASVSCPSMTACVAVGGAENAAGRADVIAAAQAASGRWGDAVPSGRLPGSRPTLLGASLDAVTCSAPQRCVGVGAATTAFGSSVAVVRLERGGWHVPQVARSVPPVFGPGTSSVLRAIACAGPDRCVAVGSVLRTSRAGTVLDARAVAVQLTL